MHPMALDLPNGCVVTNCLYPSREPDDLTQDLLTVGLPNGVIIDVGWYPESDPSGRYVIRAFDQFWDRQLIKPIETTELDEVVRRVESLSRDWSRVEVIPGRWFEQAGLPATLDPGGETSC